MANASDFLFELYTEEIPASYQIAAIEAWRKALPEMARQNSLDFTEIKVSGTARRIYALVSGLSPMQKVEEEEMKGPPKEICYQNDQPSPALLGFAKKAGVDVSKVTFREIDKKEYATAIVTKGGREATRVMSDILEELVKKRKFPKSMRWGNRTITYARPILQYHARYGASGVTFSGDFWSLIPQAEPLARLWPERTPLPLADAATYETALAKEGVIVDDIKRREKITAMLHETAGEEKAIVPEELLDEVNFLVERPVAVRGSFEAAFLELPDILILSEMNDHQRYFGLKKSDGSLSNDFITIANGEFNTPQAKENIKRGNEKVLRARLSDGTYFFREDRKKPLAGRIDDLKRVVYQEGMGTLFDKKERLKTLAFSFLKASGFAPELLQEKRRLEHAADLAKADLTTLLVYEFDHLQGEIGAIYAAADGEEAEVSRAIAQHYLPRHKDDDYPSSPLGIVLSVADKMDNIIAGFVLNKQPTAAQDPLGLRRQTLYVIEMIIENKIGFSIFDWVKESLDQESGVYPEAGKRSAELFEQIREFVLGRLSTIFEKEGFDKKLIRAALYSGTGDLYQLYLKLAALRELRGDERFSALMEAFKRMNNILNDFHEKNGKVLLPATPDSNLFDSDREKDLNEMGGKLGAMLEQAKNAQTEDYRRIFEFMASGKETVDGFFDDVMVMHEDESIRLNRLSLLQNVVTPVKNVLDISQLQ